MPDLGLGQHSAQVFGFFNRDGPHKHGLPLLVKFSDFIHRGLKFLSFSLVNNIRIVEPNHRFVRRDDHNIQIVDLLEFRSLRVSGARHAGQFVVHPEVILEGDRSHGLVFLSHSHPLFGLNRLVQSIAPASAGHHTSRELIHDDDLSLLHHVLHVLGK